MTRRVWPAIGFGLLGLTLLTAGVVHATGTAAKCAAGKQKAAGKAAASLLKCFATATQKMMAVVDSACVTKAQGKFSATFGKLNLAGGCAGTGNDGLVFPAITSWVTERVAAQPPIPPCQSAFNHPTCGATADTALCYQVCFQDRYSFPSTACVAPSNDGPCFWSSQCPIGDLCINAALDGGCSTPNENFCARVQLR